MFEQSFVTGKGPRFSSFVWGILVVAVLIAAGILVPMAFPQSLPALFLREKLRAPGPPPGPPLKEKVVKVVSTEVKLIPRFKLPDDKLYQPKAIPKEVAQLDEPPASPPAIPCAGCVIGGDPKGVPFGVPYTAPPIVNQPPPPPKAEAPKPQAPQRIRVGGSVQRAKQLETPSPIYPPLAKAQRISGTVSLSAVISKDGRIEQLTVISGHPMLIQAALDAVSRWRYQPTLLNGEPVEVWTQIDVNFTLTQ